MPSKYSHSAVLAGYSSQGLISLPNDQSVGYFDSIPAQRAVSQQTSRSRTSSSKARPRQTSPAHAPPRPYVSSDNLSVGSSRRARRTDLYHDMQRRIIIDSDTDEEKPRVEAMEAPAHGRTSRTSLGSEEITQSWSQRGMPALPTTSTTTHQQQPDSRQNRRLPSSKAPSESSGTSLRRGVIHEHPSSLRIGRADEAEDAKLSSETAPSEPTDIPEEPSGKVRRPIPRPQTKTLHDLRRQESPLPHPTAAKDSADSEAGPEPEPSLTGTCPKDLSLNGQNSGRTTQTHIYNPLPNNADFDDFSDTGEPAFIQRLVVSGRGTTSSARHSPRGPSSAKVKAPLDTTNVKIGPSKVSSEALDPRSMSKTSNRKIDLRTALRHCESLESLSSLSVASDREAAATQKIGVPSVVRATPTKSKRAPIPTDPKKLATPISPKESRTSQPIAIRKNRQPPESQRQSKLISAQTHQQLRSNPPLLPELEQDSLGGRFGPTFFDDDGDGLDDDEYISAAGAASLLRSQRRNLAMQPQSHLQQLSRHPQTHLRDANSDTEINDFPDEAASAVFPPDIAMHKARSVGGSPAAMIEGIRGGYADGRSTEERVKDAEARLKALKTKVDGRGRSGGRGKEQKEKDSGGGFLKRLRERSMGRKR